MYQSGYKDSISKSAWWTHAASSCNRPHQRTTFQLCQDQEVDLAATTLINLSMAMQKEGGGEEGDRDWGADMQDTMLSVGFQ